MRPINLRQRGLLAGPVLVAATLFANTVVADEAPAEPSDNAQSQTGTESHGCSARGDDHPHDCEHVPKGELGDLRSPQSATASSAAELASKASNPSAPLFQLATFMDVTQHGGSAPGAHRASYTLTVQPTFPFQTYRGNFLLRPAISADFGQPFVTSSGNVETAVQFGNITLDSVFGKTFKNGLIFLGGANTTFPTGSKPELRADWAFGPEITIGYASKKTGNLWGSIIGYFWSFPSNAQTLGGQYFYAINLGSGWQIAASPFWSYTRTGDINIVRFPLAVGVSKLGAVGKKDFPLRLAVQLWAYTPPPDASGPEWQVRILIAPIFNRPWQQQGPGTMRNRRKGGG